MAGLARLRFGTTCPVRGPCMDSIKPNETAKPALPQGYRQGLVTAITVFLGFSLSFMRFWSLENPGEWNWKGILSTCILAAGIAVQLVALFRALDLRDDEAARYRVTVRYFFGGIVTIVVGVVLAIVVAV